MAEKKLETSKASSDAPMVDESPPRAVFVGHNNCWGKYTYTPERAYAEQNGGGNFVFAPHTTQVTLRVDVPCSSLKYGIELHVLDSSLCDSLTWREKNCQVQALLANGSLYGAYCQSIPVEEQKDFLHAGDTFGVEIDQHRREGVFVVNGTRLSTKFALPPYGVTLQVRLHDGGAVSIVQPPSKPKSPAAAS